MDNSVKKKKKIKAWHILAGIAVFLAAVIGAGLIATAPGRREVKNLTFADIDFSRLHDGTYSGSYKGVKDSSWDTAVEVTISSGKITQIRATGGALAGKQSDVISDGFLDDLFRSVIDSETLQVDTVSGATLTSNSYLKALEVALIKAQSE